MDYLHLALEAEYKLLREAKKVGNTTSALYHAKKARLLGAAFDADYGASYVETLGEESSKELEVEASALVERFGNSKRAK